VRRVLVMGVSGSGKTTVGEQLAGLTGSPWLDADTLHSPANIGKMAGGTPLTDADRWPWLDQVAGWIADRRRAGEPGVVGCSALKRAYRDRLRAADPQLRVVYLETDRDTLIDRLEHRRGHFFPRALLEGQLADLEPPGPDEDPIIVPSGQSPEATVAAVVAELGR
jgi:carbohydrate kinase (thermoresistant glucokinase family)